MSSPRQDLHDLLKAALAVPKRQFYSTPSDVVKLNAVIIQNSDPMIELDTMTAGRFRWNLEVICATSRANPKAAVVWCEDIARDVFGAVSGSGFKYISASAPEQDTFNNLDAVKTVCTVQAFMAT